MEANKDKKLDDLIRKSVKEIGLESPSADFTKTLLSKIDVSTQIDTATAYKPLISKAGWVVLTLILVALSGFALYGNLDSNLAWLEKMNMGALPELQLMDALPNLAVSNIFFYGFLIFGIFAFIQLLFFKQRLDRQYA
ncbi:hypothetical protein [Muriicola sp. Z0-33]|uniref:hypothetical protein n=1 Tax=Muriicola sp. Z0-33 TaxID=2816957 RepID=UPI002238D0B4|nr:hypothetical protein [Muriicola sp. Z0-33]MCW5517392.1 hypothetical protein [Muriicola sp. Z0-33]